MSQSMQLGPATPFFIVSDLADSLAFYTRQLGFESRFQAPTDEPFFAVVGRDETQLMLKFVAPDVGPLPNPARHPWAPWDAFVHAADPDSLASEFEGRDVAFHRPLGDTEDGLRGFEVADPDGYVLFFGRPR